MRAPGRVNLIGEHIDYCDLAVLPMAIQRDLRVDFRPREDDLVRLANTNAAHGPVEFRLSSPIEPAPRGHWSNYVRAAAEHGARELGLTAGMDAVIDGNIPEAAGLSSSSALLVGSMLALLAANSRPLGRLELALRCAQAERFVGTHSGGMDQAACLLAREGAALRVEFAPLAARPIPLPAHWRFVIADSLRVADKSGSLRESYNARRGASEQALARLLADEGRSDAGGGWRGLFARQSPEEVLRRAERVLEGELLRRARHVIRESARVESATSALLAADAETFGALMDASQASLREDCEVSTEELDLLCGIARRHGALGARLTGAGLGGSIVALVLEARAETVLEALAENYFAERLPARELRHHLMLARPSQGAS